MRVCVTSSKCIAKFFLPSGVCASVCADGVTR